MSPPLSEASSASALAALGELRECLAAARNLEHLTSSRSVGPKVLGQVLADVAGALSPFETAVVALRKSVLGLTSASEEALGGLSALGVEELSQLRALLSRMAHGPVNAKPRLELERHLKRTLPSISAALAHWEILVESASADAVVMSVEELLSSAPDRGTDRPYRPLVVLGELHSVWVSMPPRLGLRCLAAWLGHTARGDSQALFVRADGEYARFERRDEQGVPARFQLPLFPHVASTPDALGVALGLHGAHFDDDSFFLPRVDRQT